MCSKHLNVQLLFAGQYTERILIVYFYFLKLISVLILTVKQAGAELGQAQIKLGLGFTPIWICCIEFIYTRFYWLVLTPATA